MTAQAKLQRLLVKHDYNYRALARTLGVNHYYVVQYFRKGIEPTNPVTRAAMFLPKTQRKKPGTIKTTPTPPHWNWWRHLTKDERDRIMQNVYELEGEQ